MLYQCYLMHILAQAQNINRNLPQENSSYISGKWNFLTLILKTFVYFLKRKLFIYFRKQKHRKHFFYFHKTKRFFSFRKRKPRNNSLYLTKLIELSNISRNRNFKKVCIFWEINFLHFFLQNTFL